MGLEEERPAKRGRGSHPKTEEAEGGSRSRENGSGLPTWRLPTISMVGNVNRCWENQRNPEPVTAGPEPDREGRRDQVSGSRVGNEGRICSTRVLKESCSAGEGNK